MFSMLCKNFVKSKKDYNIQRLFYCKIFQEINVQSIHLLKLQHYLFVIGKFREIKEFFETFFVVQEKFREIKAILFSLKLRNFVKSNNA